MAEENRACELTAGKSINHEVLMNTFGNIQS